jgi:hypothetical protein
MRDARWTRRAHARVLRQYCVQRSVAKGLSRRLREGSGRCVQLREERRLRDAVLVHTPDRAGSARHPGPAPRRPNPGAGLGAFLERDRRGYRCPGEPGAFPESRSRRGPPATSPGSARVPRSSKSSPRCARLRTACPPWAPSRGRPLPAPPPRRPTAPAAPACPASCGP